MPDSHAKTDDVHIESEKGGGSLNGNDTEKLARNAKGAAYLWAADRR